VGLKVPYQIVKAALIGEMAHYRSNHLEGDTIEHLRSFRHRCADYLFRSLEALGYPSKLSPDQRVEVLMGAIRVRLFNDAAMVLEWCRERGLATGVISNWDCSLSTILAELIPTHDFKCVIISAIEGMAKSDTRLFLKAANHLGVEARHIIHIGDEEDSDFTAARAAGFLPVLLDRSMVYDQPPGIRIRTLSEFPSIFDKLLGDTSGELRP
jgi:FMN phosphatase YigB (HAD superfamily)